jgi:hypothetical protein
MFVILALVSKKVKKEIDNMIKPLLIEEWLKNNNIAWTKSRSKGAYINTKELSELEEEEDIPQQVSILDDGEPVCLGRLTYKFNAVKSAIIKVEYMSNRKRIYTFSEVYKDAKGNLCETGFTTNTEESFVEECERRQLAIYVFGE